MIDFYNNKMGNGLCIQCNKLEAVHYKDMKAKTLLIVLFLLLIGCSTQSDMSTLEESEEKTCTFPETNVFSNKNSAEEMFVWLEIPKDLEADELVPIRMFVLDKNRQIATVARSTNLDCSENLARVEPMRLSFEVKDQNELSTSAQIWSTCYSPCNYEVCGEDMPITTAISINVEDGFIEIGEVGTKLFYESESDPATATIQLINDNLEPWVQCNSYKAWCGEIKFVENQGFCE